MRTVVNAKLKIESLQIGAHCVTRDTELGGELLIAEAPSQSSHHLLFARGKFDRFGQKQFLRRRLGILFQPIQHLLEQNSFVSRMLIQQNQAAIRFKDDV